MRLGVNGAELSFFHHHAAARLEHDPDGDEGRDRAFELNEQSALVGDVDGLGFRPGS